MLCGRTGQYVAFGVSRSGSDWVTIEVMEVESGKILEDKVEYVKFSGYVIRIPLFSWGPCGWVSGTCCLLVEGRLGAAPRVCWLRAEQLIDPVSGLIDEHTLQLTCLC